MCVYMYFFVHKSSVFFHILGLYKNWIVCLNLKDITTTQNKDGATRKMTTLKILNKAIWKGIHFYAQHTQ